MVQQSQVKMRLSTTLPKVKIVLARQPQLISLIILRYKLSLVNFSLVNCLVKILLWTI